MTQYAILPPISEREKHIIAHIDLEMKHETALRVLLALKEDSEGSGPRRGLLRDHEIDAIETLHCWSATAGGEIPLQGPPCLL
jgi:hypothetical protein